MYILNHFFIDGNTFNGDEVSNIMTSNPLLESAWLGEDNADGNNDVVVSDEDILHRKTTGNRDKSWVASNSNSTLPLDSVAQRTSLLHCACKYGLYNLVEELVVSRDCGTKVRSLVAYPDSSNKTPLEYMRANLRAGGLVNGNQSKQRLCSAVILIRKMEALADGYSMECGSSSSPRPTGPDRPKRAQKKNSAAGTGTGTGTVSPSASIATKESSNDVVDISIVLEMSLVHSKLNEGVHAKTVQDETSSASTSTSASVDAVVVSYGKY